MRLNFSYVSLALVTSSADTGVGCSRLYLKRSTSLPFSTGVSLIGLAIINTYLCEISGAKVRKIIQKTTFGEDINTISDTNTIQFVKRSVILRMGIVPNNH